MTLNGNETLGGPDAWETPITAPKSPEPSSPRLPRNLLKWNHCYHFYFFNEEDSEERESKSSGSFLHIAAFGELAPHDLLWRCRVSSTLRQKANWNGKKHVHAFSHPTNRMKERHASTHWILRCSGCNYSAIIEIRVKLTRSHQCAQYTLNYRCLNTHTTSDMKASLSRSLNLHLLKPRLTEIKTFCPSSPSPKCTSFATSASNELLSLGHSCSFDIQNNSFPFNWFFKKIFRITTDPKERILRKLSTTNKILLFRGTGRKAASRFIKWYSCVWHMNVKHSPHFA